MRPWGFGRLVALLSLVAMTGFAAAGNRNFAGVTWVLYQNRDDFVWAHRKIRDQFAEIDGSRQTNQKSYFSIPEEQYFPVSIYAPIKKDEKSSDENSFQQRLEKAAQTVEKADHPNLVINIVSHGTQEGVGREFGKTIPLDQIVNLVSDIQDNFLKRTSKQLTVWFFYSACDSGFIIDKFASRLHHWIKGTYTNGDRGQYTAPLHVFTSADDDDYGWGSEFIDTKLTFIPPNPTPDEIASHSVMPNWIDFGTKATKARFNYWSSFNPQLKAQALTLARTGNEIRQRAALRVLRYLDISGAELGPSLEVLLSSGNASIVQREAMKYFRRLPTKEEGLERADSAVLKLFEFSPDLEVRAEAAHTLNHRKRYHMETVVTRFISGHYASMTLPAKISALKALQVSQDRPKKLFAQIASDYVQLVQVQARSAAGTADANSVDSRLLDAFISAARRNTPKEYSDLIPFLKTSYFNEGIEVKQNLVKLLKSAEPNSEWIKLLISEYVRLKPTQAPQFESLCNEIEYSLQSSMGEAGGLFPIVRMDLKALTEERLTTFVLGGTPARNEIIIDILKGLKDPRSDDFQAAIKALTEVRYKHGREVILRLLESGWTEDHQTVLAMLAKLYDPKPEELRRIGPGILKMLNARSDGSVFPLGRFVSFSASELMRAEIKGPDPKRAGAALHFVASYGGLQDFSLVIESTRSPNELVRRSAIFALAHPKAPAEELLVRLEEIAKDNKETTELRTEALRSLKDRDPIRGANLTGKLLADLKPDASNQSFVEYLHARPSSPSPTLGLWPFPRPEP